MSDKVQFQTNVPVEVALKYNDGKEVTGQYGDQVLYTLTDGRVMYVPPIVKKKIDELGIGRGELFTLTKAEKKSGTRRMIEWVVTAGERGDTHPPAPVLQPNGQRLLEAAGEGTILAAPVKPPAPMHSGTVEEPHLGLGWSPKASPHRARAGGPPDSGACRRAGKAGSSH